MSGERTHVGVFWDPKSGQFVGHIQRQKVRERKWFITFEEALAWRQAKEKIAPKIRRKSPPILTEPRKHAISDQALVVLSQLEDAFDEMKWKKVYTRKNVTVEKGCESMVFGRIRNPTGEAVNNNYYPEVYRLLQLLAAELQWPCTSFTISKKLECKRHLDKKTNGDSLIVSLGKFQGGRLIVKDQPYDIYHQPLIFNGSQLYHQTEPFQGTRYSIVLYSLKEGIPRARKR